MVESTKSVDAKHSRLLSTDVPVNNCSFVTLAVPTTRKYLQNFHLAFNISNILSTIRQEKQVNVKNNTTNK